MYPHTDHNAVTLLLQAAPVPSWNGAAAAPLRTLKDIQEEEERASRLKLQLQQQLAAQQRAVAPAKEEDLMFWDYAPGGAEPSSKAPPPPPPPAARPTAAAIAAKGIPAAVNRQAPAPAKGAWAAAAVKAPPAGGGGGAANARAPALAQPARQPVQPIRPTQLPAAPQQQAGTSRQDDGTKLMFGDITLSSEFRDWCRDQLKRFTDTEDLSLIEVLLSLESRSEVADTCNMVMGDKTAGG